MITKQQRVELMQECHFTQEEIKRLTPIQANIILQEQLSASDPNWKIQLDQILSFQEKERDSQDLVVEGEEPKSSSSSGVDNTEKEELPMEKLHLDMDIGFEQKQQHGSDEDTSIAFSVEFLITKHNKG